MISGDPGGLPSYTGGTGERAGCALIIGRKINEVRITQ